ncbi:DUF4245 domain-containing protein [Streptomyces sp. enrichment culture]|uniref:DUF4245 domain-containing protein n=1 Tax=Streptomyces sp. enrichment culture TaxID=1795815 RepID=UPI003F556614
MAGTNGKQKTARSMVLSLGVTLLAGGVMYLFVPHDDSEPQIKPVDYRVELITARRAAPYPVAAPEGLSDDWKATSVRYKGVDNDTWHLGFHAPDGEYVQVKQSMEKRSRFIDDATQGAHETKATEEIDGRTWTRYTGGRYDALVLSADDEDTKGATTVVAGTGSFKQLSEMAAALKLA